MNSAPKGEGDIFIRQSLEYKEHAQRLKHTFSLSPGFRNIETLVLLYESTLIGFFDHQLRRLWINSELGFLFTVCNLY